MSTSSWLCILVLMPSLLSGQTKNQETSSPGRADTPENLLEEGVEAAISASEEEANVAEAPNTVDKGIEVRVENSKNSEGDATPASEIRIYSPYPAKPMAAAPEGWQYVPAPDAIFPFKQSVKLGSGLSVDLSITPFILVPESDGANIFSIREPGYDPSLNFTQQHTIGAMLHASTMQIEEHEKQAAKAISRLQQLLSSLPRK